MRDCCAHLPSVPSMPSRCLSRVITMPGSVCGGDQKGHSQADGTYNVGSMGRAAILIHMNLSFSEFIALTHVAFSQTTICTLIEALGSTRWNRPPEDRQARKKVRLLGSLIHSRLCPFTNRDTSKELCGELPKTFRPDHKYPWDGASFPCN
jgi:hypothetical protein